MYNVAIVGSTGNVGRKYQAVSGAGMQGIADLEDGLNGVAPKKFPYPIAGNCLPHIDVFLDNGYTKEEEKMINETRKILHDENLRITATPEPLKIDIIFLLKPVIIN